MFNSNKFASAKFERRTEVVIVDGLKAFFPAGESPEFTVQGLKHSEIAKCNEQVQNQDNLKALLEAAAGSKPAIKEAVKGILDANVNIPVDTQKRILHLVTGSLEPKIDESMAVKLAETFPVEFTELTNTILKLTGLGQVAVKKQ